MSRRTQIASIAALLLLAAHLAVGGARVVPETLKHGYAGLRDADLDTDEARVQAFGPAWVAAIDGARATVPADGAYLLLRGAGAPEGAEHWPRYELAPRRALFLGRAEDLPPPARLRQLPSDARWVVVACDPYQPPRLMPLWHLVTDLEAGRRPECA